MGQPRNAILGHLLSAFVGICVAKTFEHTLSFDNYRWLAGPLACGIASAAMTLTNTIHPPGGATAILAVADPTVYGLGWMFLPLVLIACLLMLSVALVTNNIQRRYPIWWWSPQEIGAVWKRRDGNKIMDVESFNNSAAHTLADSPAGVSVEQRLAQDMDIVLSADGVISVPSGFCLDSRERIVLEALLARLQAPRLRGSLTEKSWIER